MNFKTEPNTGRRVGATIIDYVIIFAFTFWFIMTFGEPNDTGGKTVTGLPALVPMLFWFAWLIIPESIWGTTLGHSLNGLKIISFSGEKLTFAQAFKRRVCDTIEISWCFGLVAFILSKNTQYNQRLGDIWAKTLVVDKNLDIQINEFDFEKT